MLSLVTSMASKWRARLWALVGTTLVAVLGLVGVSKTISAVETAQPQASTVVGELVKGTEVCQTFVAEYSNLQTVWVRMGTYGRENTGPVIFRLNDSSEASEEWVSLTIDASEVEDNVYHPFAFPPIQDASGRSFSFCLEAPEAEPGNAITVWGVEYDLYPEGRASLRGLGEQVVQDLTFRLEYEPTLRVRFEAFWERLAEGKPSGWGDRRFYLVLLALYLFLLYELFVQMAGVVREGEKDGPKR